jgi:type VI secretion system protein ImpA
MTIDFQHLLRPVSALDPCGPNLEYAPEFAALEQATLGTPDRQMGSAVLAGQAPDARAALERADALFAQTKDLRVAVHWQRALLGASGLLAFLEGLGAMRELLARFWDHIHPLIDLEDDPTGTARSNAVVALAAPELLFELRRTPLFLSRASGPVCLEDLLDATREASSGPPASAENSKLGAAFREQDPETLTRLVARLRSALEDTQELTRLFEAHALPAPDLGPLHALLARALSLVVARHADSPSAAVSPPDPSPSNVLAIPMPQSAPAAVAAPSERKAIQSRHDVIRMFDEICAYYQTHEPSSPLPLLVRRCRRLASLDFLEILRELAPDAVSRVELITGSNAKS